MRALLDLVFPAVCAGCQRPSSTVCAACLAPLAAVPRLAWPVPSPPGLPPPYAVAAYEGPVRRLLLAYKEEGAIGLRRTLGRVLARSVIAALGDRDRVRIVPVPSSRAARRQRGEDIVRSLARAAADDLRRVGVDAAVVSALRHSRAVRDSAGLTAAERAANLSAAFVASGRTAASLAAATVVLVDDLVTTGVTLAECASALRRQGGEVLACATIAATRRRLIVPPA